MNITTTMRAINRVAELNAMMEALKKASGFVRRELGRRVDLRYVPEILFELDTNIEYAAHINQLLKETQKHGEPSDD